jgi:hypothetical protein
MNLDITRFSKFCLKPYGIVILTVLMSYLAWQCPGFHVLRHGFDRRASLFSTGTLVMLAWYACIILPAGIGFACGKGIRLKHKGFDQRIGFDDALPYYVLTVLGNLGFWYMMLFLVKNVGLSGLKGFILAGEGNQIKETLYQQYEAGPLSLRYIVILSGGVALYRLLSGLSRSLLDFVNLGELLLAALASSRLSLIVAGIIGVGLYAANNTPLRVNLLKLALFCMVVFVLLAVYNATRNINFYQARGNDNFLEAGLSEILAYTGSPFQGALATGENLNQVANGRLVSDYSGIEDILTTDSAFDELAGLTGYFSFFIAVACSFVAAFIMGILINQFRNYFGVLYFVLLYCFAELWRIFMFDKGITAVLVGVSVFVPIFTLMIPRRKRFGQGAGLASNSATPSLRRAVVPRK